MKGHIRPLAVASSSSMLHHHLLACAPWAKQAERSHPRHSSTPAARCDPVCCRCRRVHCPVACAAGRPACCSESPWKSPQPCASLNVSLRCESLLITFSLVVLLMVNAFPDIVHHDTPAGRKATYLYFFLLVSAMLAAILYYSISEGQLVKQASSTDSFFNLEMYSGTTECKPWYACLYQKSTGAEPTVSALRCDCSDSAGKLSRMTRNPLFPDVVAPSNWCASAHALQKYAETLPPLILAATAKAEVANVFNFFSSKASCAAVATATSISGSAYVSLGGGNASDAIVNHVKAWHLESNNTNVSHQLRMSPDAAPTEANVASWLVQDAYMSVDVSPAQAASDAAKTATGIPFTAKSAVEVTLVNSCNGATGVGGVTAGTGLYWPLVIQINTRCQDKLLEANKFQLGMGATYIISSTLLNNRSYTEYHSANREEIAANSFTVAPVPSTGQQTPMQTPQDPALKYARLGTNDYLQGLDNIQIFYPSYSSGYALAYAEYTQTFVLQYTGDLPQQADGTYNHDCSYHGLSGGNAGGAANLVEACQLTFTETLKSVFPLTDEARNLNLDKGNLCWESALLTLLRPHS